MRVSWAQLTRTLREIGVVLLAAGCAPSVVYTSTNPPPRPLTPRQPSSVAVFSSQPPPARFVEVGVIEVREGGKYSANANLIDVMRSRAAKAGCDALIITGAKDEIVGYQSGTTGSVSTMKGYRGACIVFLPSAPAASPLAQPAKTSISTVCRTRPRIHAVNRRQEPRRSR